MVHRDKNTKQITLTAILKGRMKVMRFLLIISMCFLTVLALTACGGSSKTVNQEPVVDVSVPAAEESASGSIAEAIAVAETVAEEESSEEVAEDVSETGLLQSNFNVVDGQGRVAGTLILTPFGGAELRDLEGNLIGVLTKPVVTPVEVPEEDETEDANTEEDMDEEDADTEEDMAEEDKEEGSES